MMKEVLIPESEMEVMKVLWARSPQSLPEIVENVRRTMPWEAVTVKTLLGRLVKRSASAAAAAAAATFTNR
ncbi:MAG: BlaI/MecI/CopY family transcriptional regulator [Lentisphaeria bacterium]|nr:MAG: BlaI/MecI/CopY family transcriptional regulator [Lentisphaeria bacterium]